MFLGGREMNVPLGAAKWMTLPSCLNMLTSSMAWMGCTLSFFRDVCSFLSSIPALLCTFLTFLRGVPFPLFTICQHPAINSPCPPSIYRCGIRIRDRQERIVTYPRVRMLAVALLDRWLVNPSPSQPRSSQRAWKPWKWIYSPSWPPGLDACIFLSFSRSMIAVGDLCRRRYCGSEETVLRHQLSAINPRRSFRKYVGELQWGLMYIRVWL